VEIIIPHEVLYRLDRPVAVADVVEALLGTEQLLRESGPVLADLISGLTVEQVRISVRHISQESPLRTALFAAIVFTYQKDLEKAVPAIAEQLGLHITAAHHTIITLLFCLLLFYGAESIYTQVSKKAFSKRIREQFDSTAKELSAECGISEEKIKGILEKRYGKSRIRVLAQSALSFFRPSKQENNAPISIGGKFIDSETVAEVPNDAQIAAAEVPEIARPFKNVTIELHAQDMDRSKRGWAAIVPEVSPRRLRMEIFPPVRPEQIYTKPKIRGDIMLVSNKKPDGTYEPRMFHLLDVKLEDM
jgi:hypothetical protein